MFEYVSVKEDLDDESAQGPKASKCKHIFLSSSTVVAISPFPDPFTVVSDVFWVLKLPNHSNLNGPAPRFCEFSFQIPRGSRPGEEMPPTFCASMPCDNRRGDLSIVEKAEVSYHITAVWEPSDMSETSGMCVPMSGTTRFQMLTS